MKDVCKCSVITISEQPLSLSFFTGAMGMDIGMEKAGFHTRLASEIDKPTCETIRLNRPEVPLIGDVTAHDAASVRSAAGLTPEQEIDVIYGGPPCQAFSTAGKRQGFNDTRGNVFLYYIELLLALRPRYAVIENVRGLLSAPLVHRPHEERGVGFPPLSPEEERGGALEEVLRRLRAGGYGVSFNLYNAANFGSPQLRERVVLICARDGSVLPYLTPTHAEGGAFGLPHWRTFREAVADLPATPKDFVKFPEKRLRFYRMLKAGQYWKDLPQELHREALGASLDAGGGKTGFLRRIAWDRPAPTLVTHPAMPATDLAHPEEDRPLSLQEYIRVQEFPDDWKFAGTLADRYRQLGNAVPVSLGHAIGRHLLAHMGGATMPNYPGFRYSRYVETEQPEWEDARRRLVEKFKQSSFDFAAA